MRYPKFLKEGSKIGFAAPSFGCATDPYRSCFDEAERKLGLLGFATEEGPNCRRSDGIGISTDPLSCAKELEYFFCESECDAVFSCGGGELMCESVGFVDFERIASSRPRWFMGYSDNTNLTFLLNTLCDTASVYGPNAPSFGMSKYHPSLLDALALLKGEKDEVTGYDKWEKESLKSAENPLVPYNLTEERHSFSKDGDVSFSGRLIGGCMDCLVTLLGTRLDRVREFNERYKEDGTVWFLESCDLNIFGMRRAMWQMKNAGWFDTAKGFIIGRPLHFGESFLGLDQYDAIYGVTKDIAPTVFDVDIGHLPPLMPIISGSLADVSLKDNDVRIKYRFE